MSTHLVKIQVKMQVLSTLAQPCSSSSSSQCWEQCPRTDKGTHAPLCKELLLWLCCRAGSLRGGQISGVLYHVRGLEAPMAADLGVRGAGSPVGRGCFSSSGCWPASILPAAAATVVLYSQFFKQRFCYSNEIMTKRPSILIGSARITGFFPVSQQGEQAGPCSICWGSTAEFLLPSCLTSLQACLSIPTNSESKDAPVMWGRLEKHTEKYLTKSPWWM